MAIYDHEEQEQLDELKAWWKQYGNLVTGGLLVVAMAMAGWQGWNWWQRSQATEASAIYSLVERAVETNDAKRAMDAATELTSKYAGTRYAAMAALLSAQLQTEAGDLQTAKLQLTWLRDKASRKAADLRDLANLRLAEVLLAEQSYEEALQVLATEPAAPFVPRYAEVKGDVLAAQGKLAEAEKSYQKALNSLDAQQRAEAEKGNGSPIQQSPYREMLQVKLTSLAVAGE